MQQMEHLRDMIGLQDGVAPAACLARGEIRPDDAGVNRALDHHAGHVDAFARAFARAGVGLAACSADVALSRKAGFHATAVMKTARSGALEARIAGPLSTPDQAPTLKKGDFVTLP